MMLLQDPMIQQFIGQNPQAPKIMGAITAHIAEHVGYQMRQKIEQQLGMPLPPEDEKLPPQVEIALSGMMAQAANQVLQQDQAKAAQMQAQQQAQDPVLQIQMQELQLKQQKQQVDAQAKAQQLQIEQARIAAQKEIAAMQVGATAAATKDKLEKQQQLESTRIGVDIAKHKAQMAMQTAQRAYQKPKKERD
jgi:hypothetical protein